MSLLLQDLNPTQAEAAAHINGPCLIVAGAGSGKTRVLTYRIAYLLEKGIKPWQILSLTFTNKAAKEMRERIAQLIGPSAHELWMGTFHSVFAKILRIEANHLGYTSDFTIYDPEDAKSVIRGILKELNIHDKSYVADQIYYRISTLKNNLISPNDYPKQDALVQEDQYAKRPEFGRIYGMYMLRCRKANAMDFDDLLFMTYYLFQKFPEALKKYQTKFQYLMIDEFQDTNLVQFKIVKHLAAAHRNVCVVGDDAQSIYAFRGADIRNILYFEKEYPELKLVKLEQNYRSTPEILQLANLVIEKNRNQIPKVVWTNNDKGENALLIKALSDTEEARLVAHAVHDSRLQDSLPFSSFAILYRTNAQSRLLEEALRQKNIPYRIYGGMSFYMRKEIKDLLAYFRFTLNPNDEEAFKRIINLPKRGIGATSVEKILLTARTQKINLFEVLKNIDLAQIGARASLAVTEFVKMCGKFWEKAQSGDAFTAAQYISRESGLLADMYQDDTPEGKNRYDNVMELLNAVKEFTDQSQNEDLSLSAFTQQVSLLTGDEQAVDDPNHVTLMTVHSAKGLEFDVVFVTGLEEKLFPSARSLDTQEDVEEERRLFYVAITRARRKLYLSYAVQRYKFGSLMVSSPSRFLAEIGFEKMNAGRTNIPPARAVEAPNPRAVKNHYHEETPVQKPDIRTMVPSNPNDIEMGMHVYHAKFGIGEVKKTEFSSAGKAATIVFENSGEKKLMLQFAKLEIIED